ncbi:protein arginine kinase [Ruminiclostridium cellobioparum]|jgi:protein arginine kinase|uniref:Protein-arginine kinase n=1 Tax=Ruminiclostridium cellobioparum subsp. termitidis CT1112 TaxID=1195236 RepID=S0FRB3_RUMCE|nr:protein arginine kinase [Ruminiclostridium cellobioparum]EMS71028.1 Arginine kinase [Ruminiclostridium cellobioparum subsp. termitidis CT1112]
MNGIPVEKGPELDVAVSSRVRLARNFADIPFSAKMTPKHQAALVKRMQSIISEYSNYGKLMFADMTSMHPVDRVSLMERHLISPELAESKGNSGAFINENENVSIMVNEEDHIRIQAIFSGILLEKAYRVCDEIDSIIAEKADYAFDNKYGYLTSCPTNIGSGMRASVMLHLPALVMSGFMKSILESCTKLGVAVRGIYGENSEAVGDMFQVSNQITLGRKDDETIAAIDAICKQIIDREKALRYQLYKQNIYIFEDRIFRSYGLLGNARVLSTQECFKLLSDVRLGVSMGIIKDINILALNEMLVLSQPASLQKIAGKQLNQEERDVKRAELIRMKIQKLENN